MRQILDGTKTGQNYGYIYQRTLSYIHPSVNTLNTCAKVHVCPEMDKDSVLNLSLSIPFCRMAI